MKGRLFLVHWNAAEAEEQASKIRSDGWNVEVEVEAEDGARAGKLIRENSPDAVVLNLTRLPSRGCETAIYLRSVKATRDVPIIFVDGREEVVEKTRAKIPDAVYTTSAELADALAKLSKSGASG